MKKATLAQDQQRMELFQKQLKQMNEDYEYSKKTRDDAKKQLEARFNDLQKKIQGSKDYITSESKRMTDTLADFQHKFEHQLKQTKTQFDTKIDLFKEDSNNTAKNHQQKMKKIQEELNQEKQQRSRQFEENSKYITDQLDKLIGMLEQEKAARIQKQGATSNKINEEVLKLNNVVKSQRDDRNTKLKQLRQFSTYQIESQTKYNSEMHKKNWQQFKRGLSSLQMQMNTRFQNKDQIINSLSKVVKTLQQSFRNS